jgi:integral membrane protein
MVFKFLKLKNVRYYFVRKQRLKIFLKNLFVTYWLLSLFKIPILKKAIKVFKIISTLEAVSFLVLLGIAMPLKYVWDLPQLVQIVGMAHGVLFLLYIAFAVYVSQLLNWGIKKLFIAVLCSVVPFGPFYVERNYL